MRERLMTCLRRALVSVGVFYFLLGPAAGQSVPGLRVNLFVDERAYKAEFKDGGATGKLGYRKAASRNGALVVWPSHEYFLKRWKGNGPISETDEFWTYGWYDGEFQFLPALFVLEVTNESPQPVEIIRSYLRVRKSITDRQPFIGKGMEEFCDGLTPILNLFNDGWRNADNAVLNFNFGSSGASSKSFRIELGTLGNVGYDPEKVLTSLMPKLPAFRAKPPRCAFDKLEGCLDRLETNGQLGGLAGKAQLSRYEVFVTLQGTLSYQWKHHPSGELRTQQHPVEQVVFLFKFDTGQGPECGAGGPDEKGYKSVTLPTDTSDYQVPLPYRGALPPRGNRRFNLPIKADRASSHEFEVVVETADGRTGISQPVSLLYFVPTKTRSPMRVVR